MGTTYSGSGAVFDYLAGRGDLHDPLDGAEYLLPQVPYGLMALEAAAGYAFHHAVADHAVAKFQEVAQKLGRPGTRAHYGKGYARRLNKFAPAVERFIDDIVTSKFTIDFDWHRQQDSTAQRLARRFKTRLGIHSPPEATSLLVGANEVVSCACKMHELMFMRKAEKQAVLLNQAGSGWNPVESTKYFNDRKVVLVTRDPRDQFAELN